MIMYGFKVSFRDRADKHFFKEDFEIKKALTLKETLQRFSKVHHDSYRYIDGNITLSAW